MTKEIQVALSGSGFKFPAHVGALKAIEERGYKVSRIAGTSGGSIIASLYASGMSINEMVELSMNQDWSFTLKWSPLAVFNKAYCNGNALRSYLIDKTKGRTFEDLDMDLLIEASDIRNECGIEFSKTNTPRMRIADAARVSASIPFVFSPYMYEGRPLMDGGMANNIAVDRLDPKGPPRIGIQLTSNIVSSKGELSDLTHILELLLSSQENAHVEAGVLAGASVAFVDTSYAGSLDTNMSQVIRKQLMDTGYQKTLEVLEHMESLNGVSQK